MANTSASGGYLTPISPPPPDDQGFETILAGLVSGVTGLAANLVRPRWQRIPPPAPEVVTNWCAVGPHSQASTGLGGYGANISLFDGVRGQTTTQSGAIVTCVASFYGPSAGGYATLFRDGLMIPQNREKIQLLGWALTGMPRLISFVPEKINQLTQRIHDVLFDLNVPYTRIYAVLSLLEAEGTLNAEGGLAVPFSTRNVTTPPPPPPPPGGPLVLGLADTGDLLEVER